jgi:hypothetical protein
MNRYLILTGLITIVIYSMIHLGKDFFSRKILIVAGMSLLMGFCVFKYDIFTWNKYLGAVFFSFISGVAAFYSNKILPAISERILHIVSFIYVYQLFINYDSLHLFMFIALFIPVVIIIYYSISLEKITDKEKVLLYSLFIFILIYVEFYNLKMIALYDFPKDEPHYINIHLILSAIFISGILFYITVYSVNLLQILPIRRKDETDEAMRKRLEEDSLLFISKFSDKQAEPHVTIVLTVLLLGILGINVKYNIIRNSYLTEYFLGFILTCFQNKKNIYSFITGSKKLVYRII